MLVDSERSTVKIIDYYDSTGLIQHNKKYFRYVRAFKSIISYNEQGLKSILFIDSAKDVHDIIVFENKFYLVSTGSNEIQIFNQSGELINTWHPGGNGDAWHLNCLCIKDNELHISAFGKFNNHREWKGNTKGNGFILNTSTNKNVIDNLNGPHHPRFIDNTWWICDSHTHTIKIFNTKAEELKCINFDGFTRGICETKKDVIIGVNHNRGSNLNHAKLVFINPKKYIVNKEIIIPFPEIYDIIPVSNQFATNFKDDPNRFKIENKIAIPKKRSILKDSLFSKIINNKLFPFKLK